MSYSAVRSAFVRALQKAERSEPALRQRCTVHGARCTTSRLRASRTTKITTVGTGLQGCGMSTCGRRKRWIAPADFDSEFDPPLKRVRAR